jgi:GWxTD domain-containing protein
METPDGGRSLSYTQGEPDFDMEAIEIAPDSASGVDLFLRIPQNSLIFLKRESFYVATFEVRVRFVADRDGLSQVDELWADSVRTQSAGGTQQFEETVIRRRYALVPGAYLAEVSLQDMNTSTTANRRQAVRVFDIASGCAAFTRIRLEYRNARGMTPYLPLHIRENVDSLRALLVVYHPSNIRDGTVRATLLRYPTDSVLSTPPYYITPLTWSLRSRGVDLTKPCTLRTARRQVSGDDPWTLSFDLGHVERGMHELIVDGLLEPCDGQEGDRILLQRRYLCVVGRDFPRLTTLGQLIEVLPYLARDSEYREFFTAGADRLRLFEKFWLGLGGNAENARNLMRYYYTRAEEANLLFSNHKEGWKTDRGMISIVFGPPSLIERQLSSEVWSYSNGYRFVFERVRRLHGDEPFENYILVRDALYERVWTKEVERWRRGVVF